jgi:hypothetical protein
MADFKTQGAVTPVNIAAGGGHTYPDSDTIMADQYGGLTAEQHRELDKRDEIAEVEVYFALDDLGHFGFGLSANEARVMLIDEFSEDGTAIRSFSIRVRARKPHVELGPEIDIADRDIEAATVSEGKTVVTILSDDPEYAAAQKGTANYDPTTKTIREMGGGGMGEPGEPSKPGEPGEPLPAASRASQHSS